MPARFARTVTFLFTLLLLAAPIFSQDPTPPAVPDDAYESQRKFAIALLNQQKHMEALPVFESLAKQNSNDPEVLFGWSACLVNHSATVTDPEAARKERIHARELLLRAKELGKQGDLLMNLLDLLPPDGSAPFGSATAGDASMRAGEAAFAKNDYDEAIKNYSRALELDPKNYYAALFVGDSYFAKKDFPNAVIWYDKAIALDPNVETAYRYEADLLIKSGEMEKARTRSIQAVIANPYSQVTWRALNYWATSNKLQLNRLHINTPATSSKDGQTNKKHFPDAKEYRHSLAEESQALNVAALGVSNDSKNQKKPPADPDLALLAKLFDAKMIEPYVLLSAPDRDIALNDYVPYREQHRDQLEAYLSQFIVPPTPPKQ